MDRCYICLEDTDTYTISKCGCKTWIHPSCYNKWLDINPICMICSKQFNVDTEFFKDNKNISNIFIHGYINILTQYLAYVMRYEFSITSLINLMMFFTYSLFMIAFVLAPFIIVNILRIFFLIIINYNELKHKYDNIYKIYHTK